MTSTPLMPSRRRHAVLGVPFDDLPEAELKGLLELWVTGQGTHTIVTPNPEFILQALRDTEFRLLLKKADLSLPDGVGLRFAVAALSDERLHNRHTGADTLIVLAELCAKAGKRLVLLGGSPRKTQRAAEVLRQQFSGLDCVTFDPGIIDQEQTRLSEATLAGVERLKPDVVAIALGQVKQEKVMDILKMKIPSIKVLIGIGGAADYVAQTVQRAPKNWQKRGFEWLWRLIQEPWRWQRILKAIVAFPVQVAWATLRQRRFWRAVRNVSQELRRHFSKHHNG